jgi:hypothetical protein
MDWFVEGVVDRRLTADRVVEAELLGRQRLDRPHRRLTAPPRARD